MYRRLVQAKLFIDAEYASAIDLDNISNEACFSKFHFIRLFNRIYGKTPHQYLIHVRIEKAKMLLKREMPVAEVCHLVGFDSISSFTGLFKKLAGQTPSQYQQQHKTRLQEQGHAPLKFVPGCFADQLGYSLPVNNTLPHKVFT